MLITNLIKNTNEIIIFIISLIIIMIITELAKKKYIKKHEIIQNLSYKQINEIELYTEYLIHKRINNKQN